MGRYFYCPCLFCHLELLSAVARKLDSGLPSPILGAARPPCKPRRAPEKIQLIKTSWTTVVYIRKRDELPAERANGQLIIPSWIGH